MVRLQIYQNTSGGLDLMYVGKEYNLILICFSSIESQSKVEVMELSDLHHPNCKINRKLNSDLGVGVGAESCRRESESSDSILLSPEASKATEAVEFIAEHLRNEDLYIQVTCITLFLIYAGFINFSLTLSLFRFTDNCYRNSYCGKVVNV